MFSLLSFQEKELRKEAKEALAEQSKRAQDEKNRLTRKIEDLEKILRETRDMVNKERKKAVRRAFTISECTHFIDAFL